jgi:hypothetical protein
VRFAQKFFLGLAIGMLSCALGAQTSLPPSNTEPFIPVSRQTNSFDLQSDEPGQIIFLGSETADLFSREIQESLNGILERNYVSDEENGFPAGFLRASPAAQPWGGTMWTRDGGTFLRELVAWGYYKHACLAAQCLMNLVGTNGEGFISFPRYFGPTNVRSSGTEMDGHAAIIIGIVSLWQRLPAVDPFRSDLFDFLHRNSSPVRYLHHELEHQPLIAGSGEFGGGGPKGLYDNVVQNNLCALALLASAEMEEQAGDRDTAKLWRKDAKTIFRNMERYLVAKDGSWVWCIDPKTLKPDPAVLQKPVNVGFGGLNGVLSMSADVLGFIPRDWQLPEIIDHSQKTFDTLYAFPLREEQFRKYGFWPQFNLIHNGQLSSPSYGQGYALQTMLLLDHLEMAEHGLEFLAHATYESKGIVFSHGRLSPYYFYERLYSPDALGKGELSEGCGPLNLVNVTEPLKVARLLAGVDDTSRKEVRIIPRLPSSWSEYRMKNWPIRTSSGIARMDLLFERKGGRNTLQLRTKDGAKIPALSVRLSSKGHMIWKRQTEVTKAEFEWSE